MQKTLLSSSLSLALALTSASSFAATVLHTDQASFLAAVSVDEVIDFESDFAFSSTEITFGSANFISTDGTGLHRTTGFSGDTVRLAAQNSGGIRIDLDPGFFAIGMDVGELFSGVSFGTFSLLDTDNNLIGFHEMEVGFFGPTPSFIGWSGDVEIGSFQFDILEGSNTFETIDNVMLGNSTSVVPVPAAAWLFGSGMLALTGLARRKKTA